MTLFVNHYVNKEIKQDCVENLQSPKLEFRSKSIIITENDTIVFCCKFTDFVSAICGESLGIELVKRKEEL